MSGTTTELRWAPPAKGDWRGLHDHFPRALVPENEAILEDGMVTGEAVWLRGYGFPVGTMAPRFVHGRVFISPTPLVGPRSDTVPPAWAMKVALRLVPAFRRAARASARAVVERPWRIEAERWFAVERAQWEERDAALAAIDPAGLADADLVEHLAAARALVGDGYRTHFRLHGCDLIPTGMLLARALDWGLDPVEVAGLLAGWSPASRGDDPQPDWCLVTGYNLDDRAAVELPPRPAAPTREPEPADAGAEVRRRATSPVAPLVGRAAVGGAVAAPEVDAAEARLREAVPAADHAEFDRLLDDARVTYGVRDSNGLLTAAWPMGLLRRAMLAAGDRLAARGALHDRQHAVELTVAELAGLLRGPGGASATGDRGQSAASSAEGRAGDGRRRAGRPRPRDRAAARPTADVAAARRAERARLSAVPAPVQLGPAAELPVDALPPGMRTLTRALLAVRDLGTTAVGERAPLQGVAIGTGSAVGRACVATDPAEAFARFEPGDVVVTAGTCPAWNQVLALAGGIVTEEGGPLSHAAVIARELGLPAVVGCVEATTRIPDGATIELDAATGRVRVLA